MLQLPKVEKMLKAQRVIEQRKRKDKASESATDGNTQIQGGIAWINLNSEGLELESKRLL